MRLKREVVARLLALVIATAAACQRETSSPLDLGSNEDLPIAANDLTTVSDAASSPDVAPDVAVPPDLTTPTCTLCANGGTCVVTVDGATCVCADGYSGDTCEINIDDCTPNPCHNGGTCVDQVNGFVCTCAAGFLGATCDDIDPCVPNPCEHGGTCANDGTGFTCTCDVGWVGATCHCPTGFGGASCTCPTPPQEANFTALASAQVAAINDVPASVHITGSANINVVNLNGLGIVGGLQDLRVDNGETMDFTFDFPARALTISASSVYNTNANVTSFDIAVEAFNPAGASLGVQAIPLASTWNLTTMYGGALLGRVRVKGNPDSVCIGAIAVTYECD